MLLGLLHLAGRLGVEFILESARSVVLVSNTIKTCANGQRYCGYTEVSLVNLLLNCSVAYPFYGSLKAINDNSQQASWLGYWIVLGLCYTLEYMIPFE
jgi:hypothetical protein